MSSLEDSLKIIDELDKLYWEGQGSEPDFRKIKHHWYETMQDVKRDIERQKFTDEEKEAIYNFVKRITALWIKIQENKYNGLAYFDMPERMSLKNLIKGGLERSGYKEDKLDKSKGESDGGI